MGARSTNSVQSFFDDFFRSGGDASSPAPQPFQASGGNTADGLEPGNGYAYHTFTSSGSFVVLGDETKTMEILMVGGGGGSGPYSDSRAGGGGAAGAPPRGTGAGTAGPGGGGAANACGTANTGGGGGGGTGVTGGAGGSGIVIIRYKFQ